MPHTRVVTSAYCTSLPEPGCELPVEVARPVADGEWSALRAWRRLRQYSTTSVAQRTGLSLQTVLVLDAGEVRLCEWTVDVLARALHATPQELLQTELLARKSASV